MFRKTMPVLFALATAGYSLTAAADAVMQAQLQQKLTQMASADQLMVVASYEQLEPLSSGQIQQLRAVGLSTGVQFKTLPMVGVLATRSQIDALSKMDGVRSLWLNEPLQYYNAEARQLTGAERLQSNAFIARNGTTFTGRGITVMVNDSGIDATHDDLKLGSKVVDNVQAATNASFGRELLPVFPEGLWLRNQYNTDLNVGHGTHCAGTIAGTGFNSAGAHKGSAPDADLIGYGSGAGLSILDALGGFDFALAHLYDYRSPIRVISNSWGSSGKFEPANPITLATYKAYKLGVVSVFAAGNDGPGEDTHNPYAQIPWGISVAAGDKAGKLAGFSSRGKRGESGSFSMPDNTTWTYNNEPSITAPGVNTISTRAKTNLASNGGEADIGAMPNEYLPYYTMISGTSMATPHVAGVVATMLEANPQLTPLEVKRLLQQSATNIPGREKWEVGAGYVNAHAASAAAHGAKSGYATTVNNLRSFYANAILTPGASQPFELLFVPAGPTQELSFEVNAQAAWIMASAETLANTVKLKLTAPDGTVYYGNLSLPVLGSDLRVSAPAQAGTWKLAVYGMTSLSGIKPDPTGLSNGPGLPETVSGTLSILNSGGYTGIGDVGSHAAKGAIQYAIQERLMDGYSDGKFRPDAKLSRAELAQYLVQGAGARQYRPFLSEPARSFSDVSAAVEPFVAAVTATGGALKDRVQIQAPLMLATGSQFAPTASVSKLDLAYSLVQALGLEAQAKAYNPNQAMTINYDGKTVPVLDASDIPAAMRGYVQIAMELGIIAPRYVLEQGPYDLYPTLKARFEPTKLQTRADFAVIMGRWLDGYSK